MIFEVSVTAESSVSNPPPFPDLLVWMSIPTTSSRTLRESDGSTGEYYQTEFTKRWGGPQKSRGFRQVWTKLLKRWGVSG